MNQSFYTYKPVKLIILFAIKAFKLLLRYKREKYTLNMFLYLCIKAVNLDLEGKTVHECSVTKKTLKFNFMNKTEKYCFLK